jgi:hypothetical protein
LSLPKLKPLIISLELGLVARFSGAHGTGQVRSNTFVERPWQLREFKTDINTKGEAVASLLLMMVCKFELVALAVWRFAEVDASSNFNDFGGYNAPNYPNSGAFAALKADGSITAWGNSLYG